MMDKYKIPIKYFLGAMLILPLLPLMYLQSRRVKASIPDLPEPTDTTGSSGSNQSSPLKMLVIGESTMAGVGVASHQEGFAGSLAHELAKTLHASICWNVHAKSGITVSRIPDELLSGIVEKDWDVIVVGIGGNDAFKLNSPTRWKAQVRHLIHQLKMKFGDTPVFFTSMPPVKEFPAFTPLMRWSIGNLVELLGASLAELVSEFDGVYYDSDVITIDRWVKEHNYLPDITLYFSDGVHPSKLTYQTLARQMAGIISNTLDGN